MDLVCNSFQKKSHWDFDNLVDLLEFRARNHPNKIAYIFLKDEKLKKIKLPMPA